MPHVRKLFGAITLLALSTVVVGGGVASSAPMTVASAEAITQGSCTASRGTLRYAIAGTGISQLDPNTIAFAGQFPLQFTLYNGLTKYDKNNRVVGDLAVRWFPRNNLKNWTFVLRKGVRYSDGRPFTAADARANILRVLDPRVPSQQRGNVRDIRSVRVKNANTLVIILGSPSALLPSALIDIKMSDTRNIATLATSGTGTGPYRVASFVPNQSLALVPNQHWFGGRACLARIEFVREPDPTAMVTNFRARNLDVIWQARPTDIPTIQQTGRVLKPLGGVSGAHVWEVDVTSEPFDDTRVRQALSYAMNRAAMNRAALVGTGTPSFGNSLISSEAVYYNKNLRPYTYNLNRARQLFTQAGIRQGHTFTFWAMSGRRDEWITMAQILQQDLRQIGLNLEIQRVDQATWLAKFFPAGKKYPNTIVANYFSLPPEPAFALRQARFGSCECNWRNNTYEAQFVKAVGTKDADERQKIFDTMQQIFSVYVPTMVVAHQTNIVGVQRRVTGIWEDARGNVHLEEARVSG